MFETIISYLEEDENMSNNETNNNESTGMVDFTTVVITAGVFGALKLTKSLVKKALCWRNEEIDKKCDEVNLIISIKDEVRKSLKEVKDFEKEKEECLSELKETQIKVLNTKNKVDDLKILIDNLVFEYFKIIDAQKKIMSKLDKRMTEMGANKDWFTLMGAKHKRDIDNIDNMLEEMDSYITDSLSEKEIHYADEDFIGLESLRPKKPVPKKTKASVEEETFEPDEEVVENEEEVDDDDEVVENEEEVDDDEEVDSKKEALNKAIQYRELVREHGEEKVLQSAIRSIILDSKEILKNTYDNYEHAVVSPKAFVAGGKEKLRRKINDTLKIVGSDLSVTKTVDLDLFKKRVMVNPDSENQENGLFKITEDNEIKKLFVYILNQESFVISVIDTEIGAASYAICTYDSSKENWETVEVIDFDIEG